MGSAPESCGSAVAQRDVQTACARRIALLIRLVMRHDRKNERRVYRFYIFEYTFTSEYFDFTFPNHYLDFFSQKAM